MNARTCGGRFVRLAALAFAAGCGSSAAPSSCPTGVLVVSTDYTSTGVGVLPLDGSSASFHFAADLGSDPALATSAGRRFLVVRDRDAIFELDACGFVSGQYSAQAPSDGCTGTRCVNPYDVAVAPDDALWIARFGYGTPVASILIIDPDGTKSTLDLSSDDGDGNPDASAIHVVGGRAFVALERLNPYPSSTEHSEMAVIDIASRTVIDTIPLVGRDPFDVAMSNGALWIAQSGSFSDATETDAGIEIFDTSTLTSKLLLDEVALGGTAAEVVVAGHCAVAIIADPTTANHTSLVTFPIDGSAVHTAFGPTSGFDLRGLAWTSNELLVGDSARAAGGFFIHTFTLDGNCMATRGLDLSAPSLPPLAFAD